MANWLLDYIEMTEYIPSELREQLTSIRELDLQVHNAMDELERDVEQFFSKISLLSLQERQAQYDAFLKKCDVASRAASDKVKVADKLHELVEKSMRLLDQGLEKLKEDLLEGDKAYVVEDLERKSQELDEQTRLDYENMMQRQSKLHELKNHHYPENHHHHHNKSSCNQISHNNNNNNSNSNNNHNRHSNPAQHNHHNHHNQHQTNHNHNHHPNHQHQRVRNNSTGVQSSATAARQKKRDGKRSNSTMTIFNRNSRSEDDPNQFLLSLPLAPDNKTLNDSMANNHTFHPNSSLTMRGMIASNKSSLGGSDKSNGADQLAGAKQPILTAIDAAHAVSPNASNSDKLVLFLNPNGDSLKGSSNESNKQTQPNHTHKQPQTPTTANLNNATHPNTGQHQHLNHHHHHHHHHRHPYQNDPILMAASQAINATQEMTQGRRTSSLKASYAAVNSGIPSFEQSAGLVDNYCKCKSLIQGSDMIACDNSKCKIEWFHYECVGITTPPEGEWYCDDCRSSRLSNQQTGGQLRS